MHDDRLLVERRLDRALEQRIRPAVYATSLPLTVEAWHVPGETVPVREALAAPYEPFEVGGAWGPAWSTTWFRFRGQVPAFFAGRRVEAVFDLGFTGADPGFQAEGLAYDAAGVPIKGIHPRNAYVPVATRANGGEAVELLVEAAANPTIPVPSPTELGDRLTAGGEPLYRLARADLAVLDEEVWGLTLDIEVLAGLMRELPAHEPRRHEILRALERMLDALDLHDVPGTAAAARARLAEVASRPAHASAHRVSAVGHAHIDSAWLWPLREAARKAARTFANVTLLAEEYPELVFACSQAQQYAWVKAAQPRIFERIRAAVRAGTWAPVGSMWVEADANMPGGEALARQIVYGKRFFAEELGVETEELWLPDSFGYTAALPQLARLAGIRWFLSQKLSWNQTNTMPHHTFWWEGIDGSRVFTHFPPVDTYNAQLSAGELARAARNYAEKGAGTTSLVPFGYGDGGGGPTREMLERARRLADLEGSPVVRVERPSAFFERAHAEYPDAPVWSGELYLELHRATYTTQAKTKAGNRRSEHLLREAELWSAAAAVHAGYDYPYEELERIWKTVLLHQFHDILPGSSIAWVHREARAAYERVRVELEELIARAVAALGGSGGGDGSGYGDGGGDDRGYGGAAVAAGGLAALNAAPAERGEVVTFPAGAAREAGLEAAQTLSDGRVAAWASAPALSAGAVEPDPPPSVAPVTVDDRLTLDHRVTVDDRLSAVDRGGPGDRGAQGDRDGPAVGGITLDNGLLRVVVDAEGLLASVHDLVADREVIAPGTRGNLLQLHPDHPNDWDAWDIDRHYLRRRTDLTEAESVAAVESGPLLAAVRVERAFGASRVTQTYRLAAGTRRLDIDTEVDWRESEKVLKAAFPLDVHADRSTAEIQFGHVHRPTHANTSWDQARFEICAHRWIQVGEPGYGVAVANDSTYGHDVARTSRDDGTTTTVRLTLLRAPRSPDPRTDQDLHRFTYALAPGADTRRAAEIGYALNLPLRVVRGGGMPPALVRLDNPDIAVEAVKLADDRSGDVVVRLYEARGGRAAATVRAGFPLARAAAVDLLERPVERPTRGSAEVTARDGAVRIALRPFQILTLRLTPAPRP